MGKLKFGVPNSEFEMSGAKARLSSSAIHSQHGQIARSNTVSAIMATILSWPTALRDFDCLVWQYCISC